MSLKYPSYEDLNMKQKFYSLGRKTKFSFFNESDNLSVSSSSLSAQFPNLAHNSDSDNIRLKIGKSTFYLLSDEVQASYDNSATDSVNESPKVPRSEDDFDLKPLETNESASEVGSDCVDSDHGIIINDDIKDPELYSLSSEIDSETDYYSFGSSDSIDNPQKSSLSNNKVIGISRSLDDISMLRSKKKRTPRSDEVIDKTLNFNSNGSNGDNFARNLSSSHPHLYSQNGNSLLIVNNSSKSTWKPLRKLKKIFGSTSKLTEAEVYADNIIQKSASQINQNPIFIASPEEELQEVTGFPNHQAPFSRHSLGKYDI